MILLSHCRGVTTRWKPASMHSATHEFHAWALHREEETVLGYDCLAPSKAPALRHVCHACKLLWKQRRRRQSDSQLTSWEIMPMRMLPSCSSSSSVSVCSSISSLSALASCHGCQQEFTHSCCTFRRTTLVAAFSDCTSKQASHRGPSWSAGGLWRCKLLCFASCACPSVRQTGQ